MGEKYPEHFNMFLVDYTAFFLIIYLLEEDNSLTQDIKFLAASIYILPHTSTKLSALFSSQSFAISSILCFFFFLQELFVAFYFFLNSRIQHDEGLHLYEACEQVSGYYLRHSKDIKLSY